MTAVLPSARPAMSGVAVIAPGPAISGMASGNAARWWAWSLWTASSASLLSRSLRRPSTMSKATAKRSRPPAILCGVALIGDWLLAQLGITLSAFPLAVQYVVDGLRNLWGT